MMSFISSIVSIYVLLLTWDKSIVQPQSNDASFGYFLYRIFARLEYLGSSVEAIITAIR